MSCSMAILGSFKGEVAFRGSSDVTKGFQGFFPTCVGFFWGYLYASRGFSGGVAMVFKSCLRVFLVLLHVAARGWCQF